MATTRFSPRDFLTTATRDRFGRAGADWTGWQTRTVALSGVDHMAAAALAFTQHRLVLDVRRYVGDATADDPSVPVRPQADTDEWLAKIAHRERVRAFAERIDQALSTLDGKLNGSTLITSADLAWWPLIVQGAVEPLARPPEDRS